MSLFPALPIHNWSNRPAASAVPAGASIRIIDVGLPCGIVMTSDGANWLAAGQQGLARSSVAVPLTGTTTETVLATVTIPAGLLGMNGGLIVYSTWTTTNSANTKTPRVRFGGAAGTIYGATGLTTTASYADVRRIRSRNSASSQVGGTSTSGGIGTVASGAAIVTSALDMTAAQDLVLTAQLGLGSETITLENYEVWLLP